MSEQATIGEIDSAAKQQGVQASVNRPALQAILDAQDLQPVRFLHTLEDVDKIVKEANARR